jgi:hypothetical protein
VESFPRAFEQLLLSFGLPPVFMFRNLDRAEDRVVIRHWVNPDYSEARK